MADIDEPTITRVVSRDGTKIGCFTSGDGPPLVLVHGVLSDHTRWEPLRPHLEPHATVHAMDRRGRGTSGDAPDYDVARELEDIVTVIDTVAESSGSTVDVYGHSFGAMLALNAAPLTTNIGRLALYEPPASSGSELFPASLAERLDAQLAAGDPEAVVETFVREVLQMTDDELDAFRNQPSWPARVAAAHTLSREIQVPDERLFDPEQAATITAPTLMFQGSTSPDAFKTETEIVAAALPDARIVVLEGQGHTADGLAPALVAEHLVGFLRADS